MNFLYNIGKRIIIVAFWFLIIIGILFMPMIIKNLQDDRSITIMTWTELIDLKKVEKFEKETGIKVYLNYYDSNEEFYIKFKTSGGRGYDMVIPSDFVIEWLRRDDLIKPLDLHKITILDRIHPRLKNQFYDPNNEYSLPYSWAIFGLGIDTDFFKNTVPESWALIFESYAPRYQVAMPDTAREAVGMAAQYLYHSIDNLVDTQFAQIKNLLITQKKWVEAYTELRADYLLISGSCPVVVSLAPLMREVIEENDALTFITPQEGTFSVVDCIAIPKHTQKDDLVYAFINFLYQENIIEHHFTMYRFFPATIDLVGLFKKYHVAPSIQRPYVDETIPLDYLRNVASEQQLHNIWIALMSAPL